MNPQTHKYGETNSSNKTGLVSSTTGHTLSNSSISNTQSMSWVPLWWLLLSFLRESACQCASFCDGTLPAPASAAGSGQAGQQQWTSKNSAGCSSCSFATPPIPSIPKTHLHMFGMRCVQQPSSPCPSDPAEYQSMPSKRTSLLPCSDVWSVALQLGDSPEYAYSA